MKNHPSKSRSMPVTSRDGGVVRRRVMRGMKAGAVSIGVLLCGAGRLSAQPTATSQATPIRVTLITGDQVVITGPDAESVSIRRAPGRENIGFITQRLSLHPGQTPHWVVIPEDAVPLLAAGKVDQRLFDVTQLIDNGYDDAHRASLPLIVTYAPSTGQQLVSRPREVAGAVVDRSLPPINGISITAPKTGVHEVWGSVVAGRFAVGATGRAVAAEPIRKIWLDGLLRPTLDRSAPQIGAPRAWELGYEGDGIVVAVLDTGVEDTHPDLVDKIIVSRNFMSGPDGDQDGHGTHVASVIAGSGAASGGRYRGIAPGAQLLSGKVCARIDCPESSVIAGMQWAVAEEGAQVVNMSLGDTDLPGFDPVEEAVSSLAAQYAVLFVIAAGNAGPDRGTIARPGNLAAALTVGAVDRDGRVATFSSRGMTVGELLLKPDLTAPGVDIVAARAAGTDGYVSVDEFYSSVGGTSNATPHASGAAALLFQQHPNWAPADVKAALMGSAAFNPAESTLDQGAGQLDIPTALDTSFLASTPSSSFGKARWPHEDDEPITRTISYRNLGPATELVIELDVRSADGAPAPAEMFTVFPSTVTLPEGGTASVRVTVNTSVAGSDGVYGGRLLATAATGRSLAIPLGVDREVESYDLSVRHLDRQGVPTANWRSLLYSYESSEARVVDHLPSTAVEDLTLRLPKGHRYVLESYVYEADGSVAALTHFLAPNLQMEGDQLLVLDGSTASPVRLVAPKPGAIHQSLRAIWAIPTPPLGFSSRLNYGSVGEIAFYQAEIGAPAPELEALLTAQWLDSSASPPEFYAGAWMARGRLPAGPALIDLLQAAVVHATYAAPLTSWGTLGELTVGAAPGSRLFDHALPMMSVELPHERAEYYYSQGGSLRWLNELYVRDEAFTRSIRLGSVPYSYEAGRSYTTHWNQPPFSPAVPEDSYFSEWAYRQGDALVIDTPMHADREGHAGSVLDEGTTLIYRDGELVGQSPSGGNSRFDVPPELATYRVERDNRQSVFELTPHQTVAWTFESRHVADGATERLPLLVVRFTPELSDRGEAPSGAPFAVPLHVDRYGQASPPNVTEPSVEVSYDDGASWIGAPVEPDGSQWIAHLDHPSGARYVSLRTSTQDDDGNAVEQTLYRVYGLSTVP
jgi:subtilisin family serine protease